MKIRIFVSNRIDIDSDAPHGDCFLPVRCGAVYDRHPLSDAIGDNTGDHISERQPSYSEGTVLYWGWKNVDADYYGLCHYRRYLNFSGKKYHADAYGNVFADAIDEEAVRSFGLDDGTVEALVSQYDIVTNEAQDLSAYPEHYASVRDHYERAPHLFGKDLDILLDAVGEVSPEMLPYAKAYLDGHIAYFCQLFVMKKEIFLPYCEWLFKVMEAADKRLDMTNYSKQSLRTPGHLAERLFGIYLSFLRDRNPNLKVAELQTVLFRKPEKVCLSLPAAFRDAVPVVLAANDAFAPVCAVALRSILDALSPDRRYDIVILHRDITKENREAIIRMADGVEQVKIRFFNTAPIVDRYRLRPQEHISIETYYRFLIPEILPDYDKVLYLDSDLVCLRDVAELYDTDLEGAWIGATYDPDMQGQVSTSRGTYEYVRDRLQMEDPYAYFQAGVLLLNTKQLQSAHPVSRWLTFATEFYRYGDQDILNRYCYGHAKMLDMHWNLLIDCDHYRVPVLVEAAPDRVRKAYHEARENPYIVHFAGYRKPWNAKDCDLSRYFWKFARETEFYEFLLCSLAETDLSCKGSAPAAISRHRRAERLRKIADKYCPKGTERREVLKKILFFFIGRRYVRPDYEAEGIAVKKKKK